MKKIAVSILGGTGFGAGELLRLFLNHPYITVVEATSRSESGSNFSNIHPHLNGFYKGKNFVKELNLDSFSKYDDSFVISALPHGESAEAISEIYKSCIGKNIKIIDLSGDLRLRDRGIHSKYYSNTNFHEEIRNQAVYGLTEINRKKIADANLVSNCGCLASSAILPLAPFTAQKKFPIAHIAISSVTGSSGGGKQLSQTSHHATRHANFSAYKALCHQHEPEICQSLGIDAISFVPHRAPFSRGIFTTTFVNFTCIVSSEWVKESLTEYFRDAAFVRIVKDSPELENVVGSNFCDISFNVRENTLVLTSAIDNLVKGMAGTAIQNLNIMSGIPETTGLLSPSLRPF